ncbi:hypothetical protein [Metabacillus halosaccharovorans]|uniref:hypothetical protein n=1 Tax=Metabacillus halosaccharovorans TaxID=930124 RepID=UPI00203AA538|nr:hypothetical protein [Metabacillus halosaccharovorans]MCM3444366.1 hypothetical protein [Metabacillus halosaccharovorans]
MMIQGKHECEECSKAFEWYYLVPQHIDSPSFQAHFIPQNKTSIKQVIQQDEKRLPIKASIHCPKCDKLNIFKVETDGSH